MRVLIRMVAIFGVYPLQAFRADRWSEVGTFDAAVMRSATTRARIFHLSM